MESKELNIAGIDKAAILAALYNASRPMGSGVFRAKKGDMTVEEAREIMTNGSSVDYHDPQTDRFDYLNGRPLKIDLRGDTLRTWLFDRDNGGPGAAERALTAAGLLTADAA